MPRQILSSLLAALLLATTPAMAAEVAPASPATDKLNVPSASKKPHRPNTVLAPISPEGRNKFAQSSFASTPLSLRDLINLLTHKIPVRDGLSYDDVVTSMKARANKLNFKFVGSNAIHKDIAALSGQPARKVEVFNFCDAAVARELLDYSLEFVIFLPCRIAAVEDADGKFWLMTLDWNVQWLDSSPNPDRLPDSLRTAAATLRDSLNEIMRAGAEGEL